MATDGTAARKLAYLHFGDLHVTTADERNYRDFVALIADANAHLAGGIDFAVLPGDNADDGTRREYELVRAAIDRLAIPLEIRPGDHDRATGSLDAYRATLEPELYRSRRCGGYRCIFVNSLDGERADELALGAAQLAWLRRTLDAATRAGEPAVLFAHAYPSEHGASGAELAALVARHRVVLVDMGHTHYNELANDGRTIYAATRSTGQIEEGPVGFSLTSIDDGVVSWRFKPLARPWPFVLIASPADRRLIVDPARRDQVVRGPVAVRARVWGAAAEPEVTFSIDGGAPRPMRRGDAASEWCGELDADALADGTHRLGVTARDGERRDADAVEILVDRAGRYVPPAIAVDKDASIGANPAKGLLGTRLGPNENGHPW